MRNDEKQLPAVYDPFWVCTVEQFIDWLLNQWRVPRWVWIERPQEDELSDDEKRILGLTYLRRKYPEAAWIDPSRPDQSAPMCDGMWSSASARPSCCSLAGCAQCMCLFCSWRSNKFYDGAMYGLNQLLREESTSGYSDPMRTASGWVPPQQPFFCI